MGRRVCASGWPAPYLPAFVAAKEPDLILFVIVVLNPRCIFMLTNLTLTHNVFTSAPKEANETVGSTNRELKPPQLIWQSRHTTFSSARLY